MCRNDKEHIIQCILGLYYPDGPDVTTNITCISPECFAIKNGTIYEDLKTLKCFAYNTSMVRCENNKIVRQSIAEAITKTEQYPNILKSIINVVILYKSNNDKFIEDFEYPTMIFDETNGKIINISSFHDDRLKDIATQDVLSGAFNLALPEFDMNIFTKDINVTDDNYKWKRSLITDNYINLIDETKTFRLDEVLPFYYTNTVYKPKNPLFVARDQYGIIIFVVLSQPKENVDDPYSIEGLPFAINYDADRKQVRFSATVNGVIRSYIIHSGYVDVTDDFLHSSSINIADGSLTKLEDIYEQGYTYYFVSNITYRNRLFLEKYVLYSSTLLDHDFIETVDEPDLDHLFDIIT